MHSLSWTTSWRHDTQNIQPDFSQKEAELKKRHKDYRELVVKLTKRIITLCQNVFFLFSAQELSNFLCFIANFSVSEWVLFLWNERDLGARRDDKIKSWKRHNWTCGKRFTTLRNRLTTCYVTCFGRFYSGPIEFTVKSTWSNPFSMTWINPNNNRSCISPICIKVLTELSPTKDLLWLWSLYLIRSAQN